MARESCNLDKDEAEILAPSSSSPSAPSSSPPSLFSMPPAPPRPDRLEEQTPAAAAAPAPAPDVAGPAKSGGKADPTSRFGNRCSSCRKRVGLLGFRCRCGDLFCGRHRYSSTHDCSFDYKTVGREEISKNNPVIRAAKIIRI